MTERLYYADSYTLEFDARVIERTTYQNHPAVILDRSYFYPESGGQLFDTGTLNGVRVIDVQIRTFDQAVLHVLDAPITEDAVHGNIDAARRRDLTQHHSAQHILSAALEKAAHAATVSVHMTLDNMTIDINRALLTDSELNVVEALANEVVLSDRPVRCWFPDPADIPGLGLRKLPDVVGKLRVVDIADGFDVTACGGTHVARTGEIGLIKITRQEKFKGGARVEFKAAARALTDYAHKQAILTRLSAESSTSLADLPELLLKLRDENKGLRAELKAFRDLALDAEAAQLIAQAVRIGDVLLTICAFDGRSADDLRALVTRIIAGEGRVALVGGAGDKSQLVFGRSEDLSLDMAAALKAALPRVNSDRGGGRPNLAQGGGSPASLEQVKSALETGKIALFG